MVWLIQRNRGHAQVVDKATVHWFVPLKACAWTSAVVANSATGPVVAALQSAAGLAAAAAAAAGGAAALRAAAVAGNMPAGAELLLRFVK